MSHIFQISDEQYTRLATYAAQQKQTPEILFQGWISEVMHNLEVPTAPGYVEQEDPDGQKRNEEELLNHPLLQVAGMFAIGEPGWADKHDEYLAEAYMEDHADNQ